MSARDPIDAIAAAYRRFAEVEASGRSPLYESLARHIADDGEVLGFLLTLPPAKRQPNLLLAAVRHCLGCAVDWSDFRRAVQRRADEIGRLMRERSTQTNEPGRCAVMLPVLARLPQPLALIEVGASAGLCLLIDRYGYDYGDVRLASDSRPCLPCVASAGTPRPSRLPQVAWRAGLDLSPLDPSDPQNRAWLEALVWPEQRDRLQRLREALDVAAAAKPRVVSGDLRHDLAGLVAQAPTEATLVIFHTAVLAYVSSSADRQAFADQAIEWADFWIANERPQVFPEIARRTRSAGRGFLLAVNGEPTAWTDPHGAAIDWIG
jgi:hypothetical protein